MVALPQSVIDYLAEIGRKGGKVGGKVTSAKKARAVRKNGKKGGRPVKKNGKTNR